jgi:hypothetical protein
MERMRKSWRSIGQPSIHLHVTKTAVGQCRRCSRLRDALGALAVPMLGLAHLYGSGEQVVDGAGVVV